ncbi:ABC transporter substrate-binding protein [Halorarum salinum]|uniref:ABC transporter substrate-binding protein n=1 Tax=Halorarum salinum TaxID=2743089 RepID=A0A7D5LCL7_9EURY|nr:ABC transporter substrate-binding protein [Halobaculum salinum]QLG63592.1 ABC transporter substrate-binding protein [Halobaculum salinum]
MSPVSPRSTRRRFLAAVAATGGVTSAAGCLDQIRGAAGRDAGERLSLEIKAPPADADPVAIRIARALRENLDAAGVGARVTPVAVEELYRQVLINNEFDVYVGQYPTRNAVDPDDLYPLLHSRFFGEPGWQNPFGTSDPSVDELLERQRTTTGEDRLDAAVELQHTLSEIAPFSVLAFPDELSAVRAGRYEGWLRTTGGFDTPLGLLSLDRTDDGTDGDWTGVGSSESDDTDGDGGADDPGESPDGNEEPTRFTLATTDGRITENRNPIAVEFRGSGTFTGLLYDPLARQYAGEFNPWLAVDWNWGSGGTAGSGGGTETDGPATTATVTLRDGLTWHDGEPITAADVAFTYHFLADTSMGNLDSPVPAPRFRGRASLVESAGALDDRTVKLGFATPSRSVAVRALTVPVLPAHVWQERANEVNVPGLDTDGVTEALVWANPEPVGSGPVRFERASGGESVALSRNPDHFLAAERPPADVPERFHGKPAFDELVVQRAPSDSTAVELVTAGDVDATISRLRPATVPRIGRTGDVRLVSSRSWSFYHLGFNVRRSPLSNTRFRRTVSDLLDSGRVVADQFGGYAVPAATPLAGTAWEAPELRWDAETREAEFFGEGGELDVERAKEAFREAGFRYDEEGRLRD